VSKGFSVDAIERAIRAGITDLGENRAQELKQKLAVVSSPATWHFVGHLQTNKVRHVGGRVALVHSVDRLGLADALSQRARVQGLIQPVLIEVNVAGEVAKHGAEPAEAVGLAEAVDALEGLSVRGLMALAPAGSPEAARPYFEDLAALGDRVVDRVPTAVELSMGMSGDFEVAVEAGATIVRIGEAIFGPRPR
jgi:hypothetical protein